jgi:hypothetical protein
LKLIFIINIYIMFVSYIGLDVVLKCDLVTYLLEQEEWKIRERVPYYKPDNLLKEIDEEDSQIEFITIMMPRGTPITVKIAKFSKNGKNDTEVRLWVLQATILFRYLGADRVTPIKKGTLHGNDLKESIPPSKKGSVKKDGLEPGLGGEEKSLERKE